MDNNFIEKLSTFDYEIGSLNVFYGDIVNLISRKQNVTFIKAKSILNDLKLNSRAAIVEKDTNKLVGYIGIKNIDIYKSKIQIEKDFFFDIDEEKKEEIEKVYCHWVKQNYGNKEFADSISLDINIGKITHSNLFPGISIGNSITIKKWNGHLSNLFYPCSIISDNKEFIGAIGLSDYSANSRKGTLNVIVDPSMPDSIKIKFIPEIINSYLDYAHSLNIHNITFALSASDQLGMEILKNTKMHLFAEVPLSFYDRSTNVMESKLLYQHVPGIKLHDIEVTGLKLTGSIDVFPFRKNKVHLFNGFKLLNPDLLMLCDIDINYIVDSHINALKDRFNFAIPIGEDNYIYNRGNENEGIYKKVLEFDYVILDSKNNYCGFIKDMKKAPESRTAEIAIGIVPKYQGIGLGKDALENYYDQLFSQGYVSISSIVYDFNEKSKRLHDKLAQFNGVRIESNMAFGRLYDSNYYTAINPKVKEYLRK